MRKKIDCRDYPSETKCSLVISGEEEEVIRAASEHAVSVHGHTDGPELREQIRASLKDEIPQHA
ncbi:DUF1059 domain-containing protein [Streptomyces sp. NPDC001339]|uniref:DUF1059 domain-containing protein n=1 Tax=Streptomyces sp. NPDC001339 TaxID=3364563 RepID=UPI003681A7A2